MRKEKNAEMNKGLLLFDNKPAKNWGKDTYPIGNGTIGANLYGGVDVARLQFTVDSLWTGNGNAKGGYNYEPKSPGGDYFGSYQNLGELVFTRPKKDFSNYCRKLDIANALHTTSWQEGKYTIKMEAIASFPDNLVAGSDKIRKVNLNPNKPFYF